MPMYEYKCQQCGGVFEIIQRFSDEPLKTHEGCGGQVERLMSAPALQFKGSGWYITDYAKGGSSKPAAKNGESSGNSEKKSDSKSESKSDSGSSSKSESSGSSNSSSSSSSSSSESKK